MLLKKITHRSFTHFKYEEREFQRKWFFFLYVIFLKGIVCKEAQKRSKNIVKLPFQNIHSLDVLIGYTYRTHNTNTQGIIEGLLLNCDNIKIHTKLNQSISHRFTRANYWFVRNINAQNNRYVCHKFIPCLPQEYYNK